MFKTICTPVDNSEFSDAAIDASVTLAKRFNSELIGSHVYAAKLHDYRFKQMEFTLPEEYHDENELEKQRKIHDSLITMGLQLISDSYLEVIRDRAQKEQVRFTPKMFDGKNWKALVKDIQENQYDLVVMGAMGMGAVKESVIGSVTERVVRRVKSDVLVVKDAESFEKLAGPIVVGVDGSPESFGALQAGIALAREFRRPLEAVAVYDPYLHYAMFNSIAGVLTEKASKVFKFKEQEQLHEEVIDTGLAKIYQSHLDVATRVAKETGVELKTTLMDGKAFEKVLRYVRTVKPCLLLLGRIGVHSDSDMDIGSTSENLLRLAPCNVYLCSRRWVPPTDVRAEEGIKWTDEANACLEKAPALVRGIARTAIHRFALEKGHSVITESVVNAAVGTILPPHLAQRIGALAEEVAIERGKLNERETHICSKCGFASRKGRPAICPVCNAEGSAFEQIDHKALENLVPLEGGFAEEEDTFDGFHIRWTDDSREVLRKVPAGYERRRVKAKVQKVAKVRAQETVTKDLVFEVLRESNYEVEGMETAAARKDSDGNGNHPNSPAPVSEFQWASDALERLNRVPQGFMREMTKGRIEALAKERGANPITLSLVEEGIQLGRQMMATSIAGYTASAQPDASSRAAWSSKTAPLNEVGGEDIKKVWG